MTDEMIAETIIFQANADALEICREKGLDCDESYRALIAHALSRYSELIGKEAALNRVQSMLDNARTDPEFGA